MAEHSVALKVAAAIAELSEPVEAQVVDALVTREINKRSEALVKAIDKLSSLELEQRRIKADIVLYDGKGKITSENWSKAKQEELTKHLEKIDKYTKAITKALEKQDFSDVYNLSNADKQPSEGKQPAKDQAETS